MQIEFSAPVVRWDKRVESWFFVTMPQELSEDIRELPAPPRGFGSLRVRARIGATRWTTSIFPGTEGYLLPLKRQVRESASLAEGDIAEVELEIIDL